jgi:osmoprotectant transport system ATP-binding protein
VRRYKRSQGNFARLRQTALLVTHDLAEAAYFGNEIVLMNEGRVASRVR